MRPRLVAVTLTLMVAAFCLIGFSSSSVARAGQPPPTTTTAPEVEVGGKQVERGPEKDPVEVDQMARTGQDGALFLVAVALVLGGIGLVLVDVARTPVAPLRRPLPQRTPTWERSPQRPWRWPG